MASSKWAKKSVIDDNDDEVFASWQGLSWEAAHATANNNNDDTTAASVTASASRKRQRWAPIQEKLHAAQIWWHYRRDWPQRSAAHRGFVMLNFLSVASCIRMIMSQCVPLAVLDLTALQIVLRLYITAYCLAFLVAELELSIPYLWKSNDGFLSSFLPRGVCFTFIALIGVVQGTADEGIEAMKRARDSPESMPGRSFFLALLIQISSWMLMIAGILYILLGAFCCQGVRDQCRIKYQTEVRQFLKDMKDAHASGRPKKELERQRAGSCDFGDQPSPEQLVRSGSCDFGV